MSDYRVYIKDGPENVEIEIPDIYKDPDSETNIDQVKTYIANDVGINFTDLSVDIKRDKSLKRKCSDCEIFNGDELFFYKTSRVGEIDVSRIRIRSGFVNSLDKRYHNHNFTETTLNVIQSSDSKHIEVIEKILVFFNLCLDVIENKEDLEFIRSLKIFSGVQLRDFPYSRVGDIDYFGFLNKQGIMCSYGYCFNFTTMTYFEGNFSEGNLYNGRSIKFDGDNTYYTTCTFYRSFKQSSKGTLKYICKKEFYSGSFEDDKYCDGGKLSDENGEYIGLFKNGTKNGYGMMTYKNKDKYVGYWSDNKRTCFGKMKYQNGDFYSGTWKDDKREIFGNFFDSTLKITYIGSFKDDKRTFIKDEFTLVQGCTFYSDYIGEYQFELKEQEDSIEKHTGSCIYEYSNLINISNTCSTKDEFEECHQIYYIGHFDFKKDFYGMGTLFYAYDNKIIVNPTSTHKFYSDAYINDTFKGFRVYHCEFENGIPNGFGMINYENGDKYIGGLRNGMIDGDGVMFKFDGTKMKGLWSNGEIINVKLNEVVF